MRRQIFRNKRTGKLEILTYEPEPGVAYTQTAEEQNNIEHDTLMLFALTTDLMLDIISYTASDDRFDIVSIAVRNGTPEQTLRLAKLICKAGKNRGNYTEIYRLTEEIAADDCLGIQKLSITSDRGTIGLNVNGIINEKGDASLLKDCMLTELNRIYCSDR